MYLVNIFDLETLLGEPSGTFKESKLDKDHPLSVGLRYGEDDSISPTTLFFCCYKGLTRDIYTLYIPTDVPNKLALRLS